MGKQKEKLLRAYKEGIAVGNLTELLGKRRVEMYRYTGYSGHIQNIEDSFNSAKDIYCKIVSLKKSNSDFNFSEINAVYRDLAERRRKIKYFRTFSL